MNLLKQKLSLKKIVNRSILLFLVLITLSNCKMDEGIIPHNNHLKAYTSGTNEQKISYDLQGKPIVLGNNAINYNSGSKITIIDPYYYFTYNTEGKINTISAVANKKYDMEDASITYNNQNQIQKESVSFIKTSKPNITTTFFRNYIYDNTQKLIEIIENNEEINGVYSLKRELISYDNEGNIIKIIKQISINNGENYHTEIVTTYTYDSKKNPFYNLLMESGVVNHFTLLQHFGKPTISLGYANLKLQYYNPHNLLYSKTTTHTGNTKTIKYQYQYNKEGLPTNLLKTTISSETGINRTQFSWFYEK